MPFDAGLAVISVSVGVVTLASLIWMWAAPPAELGYSRTGVPHLTPQVMHPETGDGMKVDTLVDHFTGGLGRSGVYY